MGGARGAPNRKFSHLRTPQLNPDQVVQTKIQGHLSAALHARTRALFINEHKTEMMEAEAWEG